MHHSVLALVCAGHAQRYELEETPSTASPTQVRGTSTADRSFGCASERSSEVVRLETTEGQLMVSPGFCSDLHHTSLFPASHIQSQPGPSSKHVVNNPAGSGDSVLCDVSLPSNTHESKLRRPRGTDTWRAWKRVFARMPAATCILV